MGIKSRKHLTSATDLERATGEDMRDTVARSLPIIHTPFQKRRVASRASPAYCIVPGCACAFPAGTPVCPECGAEQPTEPTPAEESA